MGYLNKVKEQIRRIDEIEVQQLRTLDSLVPIRFAKELQEQKLALIAGLKNIDGPVDPVNNNRVNAKRTTSVIMICFAAATIVVIASSELSFKRGYESGLRSVSAAEREAIAKDNLERAQIDSLIESFEYHQVESFPNHSEIKINQQ
jgi:hypothetical protein